MQFKASSQAHLLFFAFELLRQILPVAFFLPRSKKATRSRHKEKAHTAKGSKDRIEWAPNAGMMVATRSTKEATFSASYFQWKELNDE